MNVELSSRTSQILLIVVGIAALAFAGVQAWQTVRFERRALAAVAVVVADRGEEHETMSEAHPLIEFTTRDGQVVRYNQNGMGSQPIGRRLPLLYLPADPRGSAIVATFWTRWSLVILPLIPGVIALLLAWSGAVVGVRPGRY